MAVVEVVAQAQVAKASYVLRTLGGILRTYRPSSTPLRPLHFSPTKDPAQLALKLHQLQLRLNEMLDVLRACPLAVCGVVTGVVFTAAQQQPVFHRLGRVPLIWLVVDAQGLAWSGFRTPQPGLGPKGESLDATSFLLTSNNAGTYAFLFA